MNKLQEILEQYGDVLVNEPLSKHTTYRVGGEVAYFVYPKTSIALMRILEIAKEQGLPLKVIGKGSNLLASDDFFEGIVVSLDRYFSDVVIEENHITAYAGASIIYVAFEAMKKGLSGLEFASGIPATVGGTCLMNAGAYKSDMSEVIESVWVLKDKECEWMDVEACEFSYRNSIFKQHPEWIILAVRYRLTPKDPHEIEALMSNRRERRLASQPLDKPSAGSVFKNPVDCPAWKYIEDCGLRGYAIHDAKISEKHANFIINDGQACASDIRDLIEFIKAKVKEQYGVELKAEVEYFNWHPKQ